MKTVAIIQARMGSSRLPGKVLADLAGRPALAWTVRAARATEGVDETWVATTTAAGDDPVALWCEQNKVPVCRGSELDVLDRYAQTARRTTADVVVRLTADCPLLDPAVVGRTIALRAMDGVDYASNVDPPTWPDGLDCEVLTAAALFAAAAEATRPSDREHVTPFVRNHLERFTARNLASPRPGLADCRWTLDHPDDYSFLCALARLLPADRPPSYQEVLDVLDRERHLLDLNRHLIRNASYAAQRPEPLKVT